MPPVVAATLFPDVFVLEPARFKDNRGEFLEVFNAEDFEAVLGLTPAFVQDNVSVSRKNTVRGLHWQAAPHGQGKLVTCATGTVFDVIVDIRPGSPAFLTARTVVLSGENRRVLWIPAGYAHGFAALEDNTTVFYKVTHKRVPAANGRLRQPIRSCLKKTAGPLRLEPFSGFKRTFRSFLWSAPHRP